MRLKERSEDDGMSTGLNPLGSIPSPTVGPKGHNVDARLFAGLFKSVAGGSCDDARDGTATKCDKGALHDMNTKAMTEGEGEGELPRPGGRTEKVRGEAKAWMSAAMTICIIMGIRTAGSWLGQGHAAREGE
ncbi:hypothetical protein TrRE_jg10881 [Triparma retinervis]|uniref:Uncharacterized protein n=1 Tax=Triparma retinervis TaxID=2557542 RepID=A0A9W7E3P7_9STRA|nr:hypothetical protein TrRE_jg10881 [Triparma retinervis]